MALVNMASRAKNYWMLNVIFEFLDSSSSEDEAEATNLMVLVNRHYLRALPKIDDYVENVVVQYTDDEFRRHFRVSKNIANMVIEGFEISQFCPTLNHGGSYPISATKHVLCFLWFAANKCCIRDVAERFGTGQTTCFRIITRVIDYLLKLAPQVITFPNTPEEKTSASEKFFKISGFPDVLGCIDGTSVNIRTPPHKIKNTYTNRHDVPAITIQAICNANKKFIDIFTGVPGKIHDSRVLSLSFIGKDLETICSGKYHILGDSAYPLREWLLTPYKDYGNLSDKQKKYNYTLSATRVLIENSFGLLKNRFRQLLLLELHSVHKISKFIISCCVLHNLCIEKGDVIEGDYKEDPNLETQDVIENVHDTDIHLRRKGLVKQQQICDIINR